MESQRKKDIVKYLIVRKQELQTERDQWQRQWDDLAEYILPRKDQVYGMPVIHNKGDFKHNRLYDSTAIHANEQLASALHNSLMSPTAKWFSFSAGNPEVDKDYDVQLWLEDTRDKVLSVINNSNLHTQAHENFLDICCIGTSSLAMEEDKDSVVAFMARPIYQVMIDENHKKQIDTVYISYEVSLKQLIDRYGEDNLPESVLRKGKSSPGTKQFHLNVCVMPNKDYQQKKPKAKTNRPYISYTYIEEDQHLLEESGYYEFPFAIPRWMVLSYEKYGRSPAMKALPDTKMLNATKKSHIEAIQKTSNPPVSIPDAGYLGQFNTRPGAKNYYRMGLGDKNLAVPFISGAQPQISFETIEQIKLDIRQAFYVDQLQLREADRMTATEVRQRNDDRLRLLSPITARLNEEYLSPIILRVFGIMKRRNMFLPMPDALKKTGLDIKFVSQVARAQRSSEADTLNRVVSAMMPAIEANPQVLQILDADTMLRDLANDFGMNPSYLKSPTQVEGERNQQQAQMEQAQATEQENIEADTMQKVAKAQQ
jgi:hypothetical protein